MEYCIIYGEYIFTFEKRPIYYCKLFMFICMKWMQHKLFLILIVHLFRKASIVVREYISKY